MKENINKLNELMDSFESEMTGRGDLAGDNVNDGLADETKKSVPDGCEEGFKRDKKGQCVLITTGNTKTEKVSDKMESAMNFVKIKLGAPLGDYKKSTVVEAKVELDSDKTTRLVYIKGAKSPFQFQIDEKDEFVATLNSSMW